MLFRSTLMRAPERGSSSSANRSGDFPTFSSGSRLNAMAHTPPKTLECINDIPPRRRMRRQIGPVETLYLLRNGHTRPSRLAPLPGSDFHSSQPPQKKAARGTLAPLELLNRDLSFLQMNQGEVFTILHFSSSTFPSCSLITDHSPPPDSPECRAGAAGSSASRAVR